jgi:hypothetical protein
MTLRSIVRLRIASELTTKSLLLSLIYLKIDKFEIIVRFRSIHQTDSVINFTHPHFESRDLAHS